MEANAVLYQQISQRLRSLRKAQHLTQQDLARRTGLSASFLGHIERGSRVLSVETLLRLCQAMNTTPNALLLAVPEKSAAAFSQEAAQAMIDLLRKHEMLD